MKPLPEAERWIRTISIAALLTLATVVAGWFFVMVSREMLYPWVDGADYVGLQLDNDSQCPVALGFRWSPASEWQWTSGTQVADGRPARFAADASQIEIIKPVFFERQLALRLECSPQAWSPAIELPLAVKPRAFVRLHVSREGQVSVAQGVESIVGFPLYDDERVVGEIAP